MSNKPAVTTQNTQKTPLSGPQGTLFNNIWGTTNSAVNNAENTPIPQNTVAGLTQPQVQGANWFDTVAPSLGANAQGTGDLVNQIASGFFTNPQNNPNFQGAVEAALAPQTQNLTQNVLPHVQDVSLKASGGGTGPSAYGSAIPGGSPQDKLTENVLQNWTNTEANTIGSMAENAYNTGVGLFGQIPGLSSSAISQYLAPGSALEAGGGILQGGNQSALTNLLNAYNMNTQNPLSFLSSGANIGAVGGFGNNNQTTTGAAPSMATQVLQGLTGGAGALGSLFGSGPGGSASAFSNIMGGLGSLGSSASGWLSGLLAPTLGTAAADTIAPAAMGIMMA